MIETVNSHLVDEPKEETKKSELVMYYNIVYISEVVIRILTGFTIL